MNFKIGNRVKIYAKNDARCPKTFNNEWVREMDKFVGSIATIIDINTWGVNLSIDSTHCYPQASLRKIGNIEEDEI